MGIRFNATILLVPPLVTTVTFTVPGKVKLLVPLPAGTVTTRPVSDQPELLGTTEAVREPCVNTTFPGADWKPLPLISIGRLTGLEGVVELLIFRIEGTGGGGAEPPPDPQPTSKTETVSAMMAQSPIAQRCCFLLFGLFFWTANLADMPWLTINPPTLSANQHVFRN